MKRTCIFAISGVLLWGIAACGAAALAFGFAIFFGIAAGAWCPDWNGALQAAAASFLSFFIAMLATGISENPKMSWSIRMPAVAFVSGGLLFLTWIPALPLGRLGVRLFRSVLVRRTHR